MTPSQYAKHVIVEPYSQLERDGKRVFEGYICTPEQLNAPCQYLYSVVHKPHVNEATTHVHDFPVIMNFFGGDHTNIRDFDAEIWFYLGRRTAGHHHSGHSLHPGRSGALPVDLQEGGQARGLGRDHVDGGLREDRSRYPARSRSWNLGHVLDALPNQRPGRPDEGALPG